MSRTAADNPVASPSQVLDALRLAAPVLFAVAPFGAVYGTIAVGSGLTVLEAMGLTMGVYAGASQLAALQLVGLGAPLWSILLTVAALNFRMVLYSAAIGRHLTRFDTLQKALGFFLLVDPLFGAAEARVGRQPITKRFYFTYGVLLYLVWVVASFVGAIFGSAIGDPETLGLDLVLPVYFLALVLTFRGRSRFLPVVLASGGVSTLVYGLAGPPWHVATGAIAGIGVAVLLAGRASGTDRGADLFGDGGAEHG